MDKPLSVVIAALIHNNKILLIKRERGDYVGYWGLPGGKIEKQEHLSDAAVREIKEESGITSEFKCHLGFVSEHLTENNEIQQHFLLHICELKPATTSITCDEAGKLDWFDLNQISQIKEKIIPSDYMIIKNMINSRNNNYYNCVLEKQGENHILKKFS